jgi:gamma-glutamyltranspeptidase/glutathione hydrolase
MKHAYANRARYMGDDRFVKIPVRELLDKGLFEDLARGISSEQTKKRNDYGVHFLGDDSGTTHFSVMDREGNTVAMTSTINTFFGSLLVVEEYGIVLNNQMDDFSLAPGVANAYGLIGSEANAIVPGKKPLSSMTPTLVLQGGHPFLALGGSGGPRIISGVLQVLLNVIDHEMQLQAAVNAPRIHHQWVPEKLYVEPEIPRDVRKSLERKGHQVEDLKARNVIQAVRTEKGWFHGASDPRKKGISAGY